MQRGRRPVIARESRDQPAMAVPCHCSPLAAAQLAVRPPRHVPVRSPISEADLNPHRCGPPRPSREDLLPRSSASEVGGRCARGYRPRDSVGVAHSSRRRLLRRFVPRVGPRRLLSDPLARERVAARCRGRLGRRLAHVGRPRETPRCWCPLTGALRQRLVRQPLRRSRPTSRRPRTCGDTSLRARNAPVGGA